MHGGRRRSRLLVPILQEAGRLILDQSCLLSRGFPLVGAAFLSTLLRFLRGRDLVQAASPVSKTGIDNPALWLEKEHLQLCDH